MNYLIVEPQYFPNIQFFSKFLLFRRVIFDDLHLFQKQSYRNRTYILGANKVLPLVVPVKKGKSKIPMKDVIIDYGYDWQKLHWTSIISSYNKSPFFMFYESEIEEFFIRKYNSLVELNVGIVRFLIRLLAFETEIILLSEEENIIKKEFTDLRNKMHPKRIHIDKNFKVVKYSQVFIYKLGFIPNLSILDLLFNKGPEASLILRESIIEVID